MGLPDQAGRIAAGRSCQSKPHATAPAARKPGQMAPQKAGPGETGACGYCRTEAGVYALLKTSSPALASTTMVSPLAYCPERIFWASGFSSWAWMARLSGRAP